MSTTTTITQEVIQTANSNQVDKADLVPFSTLIDGASYAAVDSSGSMGGTRLQVAKNFVDAIGVQLVSLWNSRCNPAVAAGSIRWISTGCTSPHTIFEPNSYVPSNASCFIFMTDGEIWDTARLARHASVTAHLPTLLVLFRSNSQRRPENISSYNVSVVMSHFAAARTAAVMIINEENDPSGHIIAVKGDWADSLPPPPPLDDTLLIQECPRVSIQQLLSLPSRVFTPVATGTLTLQGNRTLNLNALLNLQDGREVVTQLTETELEDIARAFLTQGNLPVWRNLLNHWLVHVNQEVEEQVQQTTSQTSSGVHALLRRLQGAETVQEREALTAELQTALQQGALEAQEARENSRQSARQPRAIINAALAAVSALEATGMNATSLGRLSNRASRANTIDHNNLTSLASLNTTDAPNMEDLVLHEEGPVALFLRSMDQVDHNTSDEALSEPLRIGQYPENAVFEPTIVALEIADPIEEMDASPLTRQRLSVCLPIVTLRDATNRQVVYERLCLVFMNELSMCHVWLIALSSILRAIETQCWADAESPTGRLLQWFAAQIMEHVVLPEGTNHKSTRQCGAFIYPAR